MSRVNRAARAPTGAEETGAAPPTEVVAGVIIRDRRVLICQRRAGGHHPGKWEFAGGKVEPHEGLEAALRRELQEELGIDATIGALLWRTTHQYAGGEPFVLSFFEVERYTGVLSNRQFAALRWAQLGTLAGIDFLAADREFVTQLEAGGLEMLRKTRHAGERCRRR